MLHFTAKLYIAQKAIFLFKAIEIDKKLKFYKTLLSIAYSKNSPKGLYTSQLLSFILYTTIIKDT